MADQTTEFILIRSGQTDWKTSGRLAGCAALPLSKAGLAECEELATQLAGESLAALCCGSDESARQTAQTLVNRLGGRARVMDEFRDIDCGLWQGLGTAELSSRFPSPYRQWIETPLAVCPPNGESFSQAAERIRRGLRRMAHKHAGGKVAVVMGDLAMGLACAMLNGRPAATLWKVANGRDLVCRCPLNGQALDIG